VCPLGFNGDVAHRNNVLAKKQLQRLRCLCGKNKFFDNKTHHEGTTFVVRNEKARKMRLDQVSMSRPFDQSEAAISCKGKTRTTPI
jgi:hypothetical protein